MKARLPIEMILLHAKQQLMLQYPERFDGFTRDSCKIGKSMEGDSIDKPYTPPNPQIKLHQGMNLSINLIDPKTKSPCTVFGRADWAIGYGAKDGVVMGTMLVGVEAKTPEAFNSARKQLIACMGV